MKNSKWNFLTLAVIFTSLNALAAPAKKDILIKFIPGMTARTTLLTSLKNRGARIENFAPDWVRVQASASKLNPDMMESILANKSVEVVQPNYKISLPEDYRIPDKLKRAALQRSLSRVPFNRPLPYPDNPPIPQVPAQKTGVDPYLSKQWGMLDNGVQEAWKVTFGKPEIIVAVIDTGVDYAHEDLISNIWRNSDEIPDNGIDDDKNGFVDDVIGWDFVSNDNRPYDLSVHPLDLLIKGGNPGHGTHCAGNVAARNENGIGVAGVAPQVTIMPLRFISEKGEGTTADAVKAIHYAVDNGAKITSNSWGSEGEDPEDTVGNKALRDAVQYALDHGVLFIAAAGNGHKGTGYDNDTDPLPSYPATYDHDNIISVAAIDKDDKLAAFSNWGSAGGVDIGAPGVAIFSTTVASHYDDHVLNTGGFEVTWDGTSMAAPHVAGAAALYWSANPNKNWKEVKAAILDNAKEIPSLKGKVLSNGKLDVKALF